MAGAVVFFWHLLATADFKPLMTGMEPTDAQALAGRLAPRTSPIRSARTGKTVSVPSDKLDSSRLEVASEGMPHSGRLGFELFDKLNWGQTEFDEKVNYQRALEGELERTIQTLRDVESRTRTPGDATDSVFLDREREAKASVILRLRSGQLSSDTQRSICQPGFGCRRQTESAKCDHHRCRYQPAFISHKPGSASDAELEEQLSRRLISNFGSRSWERSAYAPA